MEQTSFIITSWIVSFLGGGVIGALLNWIRAERSEKKERKIKFLENQIAKFYGPLYYLSLQNELLFELYRKFLIANTNIRQDLSSDDFVKTIDIGNKYIKIISHNNDEIKKILDENYSFIDPDDIEVFVPFYENYIRFKTEIDEKEGLKTPIPVYQQIGDISYFQPKLVERVKEKFLSKKNELNG